MKIRHWILGLALMMTASLVQAQVDYDKAIGLRAAWGFGLTGKMFINDDAHAIEAILIYRDFGNAFVDWNYFSVTGLYEVHKDLSSVADGLNWYFGGGAYVGFYGGDWDYPGNDFDGTFIGLAGVLGLDYKFENIPLNVSADWIPGFNIVGGGGFGAEGGGLAVRYTF